MDNTGNVFVTGRAYAALGGLEYVTIKYAALPESPALASLTRLGNGWLQFAFTNVSGYSFTTLASTNVSLPAGNWTVLSPVPEIAPGQYQFTDPPPRISPNASIASAHRRVQSELSILFSGRKG